MNSETNTTQSSEEVTTANPLDNYSSYDEYLTVMWERKLRTGCIA